jgi:hypothetical protein
MRIIIFSLYRELWIYFVILTLMGDAAVIFFKVFNFIYSDFLCFILYIGVHVCEREREIESMYTSYHTHTHTHKHANTQTNTYTNSHTNTPTHIQTHTHAHDVRFLHKSTIIIGNCINTINTKLKF